MVSKYGTDLTPYGDLEVLAQIKKAKESGAKRLDLSDNQITDLSPLKGLTKLYFLSLYDNEISEEQEAMIKKALPNCEIEFREIRF